LASALCAWLDQHDAALRAVKPAAQEWIGITRKRYAGNNSVTLRSQLAGVKTKSFIHSLRRGLKEPLGIGLALLIIGSANPARAASAAELLEKGIYTEETKGELKAAVQIYKQLVEDPRAERSLVAQAQLRLGLCQLKLGNKPQAISALDRLTQEFPDKDKLLEIVEQRMPQVLDEIVQQIERNYFQEVDRGELLETAIRAIVGKLDPRGGLLRTNDMEFLGADELKQMNLHLDQKLAGIGTALKSDAGEVVVQSVLPNSPALKGGIRVGDRIVGINGVELREGDPLANAVKLLRGQVGTPVVVRVKRAGWKEAQEFELVRDTILLPSVLGDRRKADSSWEFMLDEQRKIGFARLTQVGRQSTEEMRAALDELSTRGMKALVLDLRNNPGGLLDGAVAISDLFVDEGRILIVKGREGETVYDASPQESFTNFPIALLVNRKTASAAEIIAACLQDHQRAVVVGERTFGQGIVRTILNLKSGVGAVKLPIAAYYRPSGKSVNRYPNSKDSDNWGVSPNPGYEIVLSDEELKQYEIDRAARDALTHEVKPDARFNDRQLQKALEWVEKELR
jgi:carboxyl-terminal processing protease